MKISYKHLVDSISEKPDLNNISEKLFQLGHEHEICDDIFDIEITPNRGDCLSLNGLLRDLNLFYDISNKKDIYQKEIAPLSLEFTNNVEKCCKKISFLKIEIDVVPEKYIGELGDYFSAFNIKKNNFFTDVSNFISYENGQPTHCYDFLKINSPIKLDFTNKIYEFDTLLDKKIKVDKSNMVFFDNEGEVINLAGIIGGKKTACQQNTKSVLVECAYFDPELIIGKSVKYDINSDAAYKFERNVDPNCHNYVLRRFIRIIEKNTDINNIELVSFKYGEVEENKILFNLNKINKILGININEAECLGYLTKLDFKINDQIIYVPSHRNDIFTINDIAEEIARAIGYNNIQPMSFRINQNNNKKNTCDDYKIKQYLIDNGFYEVINDPFVSDGNKESIVVDNPLDTNSKFLRLDLKNSLINNLLYNERRQKETIKLFEIADVYSGKTTLAKKILGIIASGRIGQNYLDFSKKINGEYLESVVKNFVVKNQKLSVEEIPRSSLNSKLKNPIMYIEIEIDSAFAIDYAVDETKLFNINNKKYMPISDFPFSKRDLSFSVKNFSNSKILENLLLNFKHDLLKETFVFDFYKNENLGEIKIGFRFIFQSNDRTITDEEVSEVINDIINESLKISSVSIPGLRK